MAIGRFNLLTEAPDGPDAKACCRKIARPQPLKPVMAACGLGEVVFLTFNPECALLKKSIGNLYERYAGHYLIQSSGFRNIYECSPPLAVRPMFLYLNKKHAALVPRIAKTLKEMKADGTLKAIRSKTLSHFDLHREAGPQH